MILYRYLDFVGGLKTLNNSALKATRPIDYNDPFEYLVNSEVDRRTFRKEFLQNLPNEIIDKRIETLLKKQGKRFPHSKERRQAELEVKRKLRQEFETGFWKGIRERSHYRLEQLSKGMAVICFTENSNNNLMWSHYCNGHRGIMIEFDTELVFPTTPVIIKIKYVDAPPNCNFLNGNYDHVTEEMQAESQRQILGYKSNIWKYEEEYRIQFNLDMLKQHREDRREILLFPIPNNSIRSVVFGCKLSEREIDQITQILDGDGYAHVERKYAIPSINDYTLEYVDYDTWFTSLVEKEKVREEYERDPL